MEEAVAAYERGFNVDPNRARHSMFRPMLKLLSAVQGVGGPTPPGAVALPGRPQGPAVRRPDAEPEAEAEPEIELPPPGVS